MKIEVINSVNQIKNEFLFDKTVVVIDVLRASSVICTALFNGAREIIPVNSVTKAFSATHKRNPETQLVKEELLNKNNPYHNNWALLLDTSIKKDNLKKASKTQDDYLLCGERMGFKIQHFNLGNSPLEYTKEQVNTKIVVLTTTNGTTAIKKCTNAQEILIGAFCNVDALCNFIKNKRNVCIVCAGSDGQYSLDDALCAGNIISILCAKKPNIELTDEAFAHKSMYECIPNEDIHALLKKGCKHYSYLEENGFKKDLDYCLLKNTCPVVPVLIGEKIRLL
ncbi:MAG: 2-phosphosulfolactate phosphatase [Paludibacteraceae bacterium]|nr:2-phosphosulfolactate phosphatase [Paludibacteraceae bacterium]MBN2788222.1 2-phosphosulfolactate phosphatase [Paludibacteraceae bacterium]